MLVPCVVKEAVSKFDAGRKKRKKRAARDATIIQRGREEGREGCAGDGSSTVIGASIFFFFYKRRDQDESLGIKPSRRNGLV